MVKRSTGHFQELDLSSRLIRGIQSRFRNFRKLNADPLSVPESKGRDLTSSPNSDLSTSFERFYRRYLNENLEAFNAFALQSRSIFARDIYALGASFGRHSFFSLLSEIDSLLEMRVGNTEVLERIDYQERILLSLARYLIDTARTDLDAQAGLQILRLVLLKYGDTAFTNKHKMIFVEALAELGHYEELAEISQRFEITRIAPLQVDLLALDRIAKEGGPPERWVESVNDMYANLGMTPIRLDENASLPLFDRITAEVSEKLDGPKVTIIMPTFSPNQGIFTAIRSLLCQSWTNLEILVVDDGSPVQFDEVLDEVEQLDDRIRVIRLRENKGAYVARNAGLAQAQGEYVTTHDDDDWSHPDKIATQAQALMDNEAMVANTVAHIRATEDMRFRRINARPQHLQTNYSSLMFRKNITDEIGGWDTSTRGSDSELTSRITHNFGSRSLVHFEEKPMSFSRIWTGSLTSGEIYRGYFSYSRLLFRWSSQQWHRDEQKRGYKPKMTYGEQRPYPIPTTFEPGNRNLDLGVFDIVYVTDYTLEARFVERVLDEIESAVQLGLRVGYMHIHSPQTLRRTAIPARLLNLQRNDQVTQISDRDQAEARLLIVYDASIGMFLDNFSSSLIVQRGLVVDDQGALLKKAENSVASDARTVLDHLDRSFNVYFRMVGAAYEDHQRLINELPPNRLLGSQHIWTPHIHEEASTIRAPRQKPVVGFHSFGNQYRWPGNRKIFNKVYPGDEYDILFYGVLTPARSKLGNDMIPDSQKLDHRKYTLTDFLEHIDFWVYYPSDRLIDRPWTAVLQAMQSGKVVIMPPRLQPIYEEGAVYAHPEEVARLIREHSHDEKKYLAQAQRGQKLVNERYSLHSYGSRLHELLGTPWK